MLRAGLQASCGLAGTMALAFFNGVSNAAPLLLWIPSPKPDRFGFASEKPQRPEGWTLQVEIIRA